MNAKNVTLTLVSKYNYQKLKPFIETHQNFTDSELIIFVSDIDDNTKFTLKKNGARLIEYDSIYPYFTSDKELIPYLPDDPKQYLSPNSIRYFLYLAFLRKNKFDNVLHTDARDVIFQGNPFKDLPADSLYVFLEDAKCNIAENKHNAFWIQHGFGKETLNLIGNRRISCSGVTIGSSKNFIKYCNILTSHLSKIPNVGGMDQGVHNYLIHTDKLKFATIIEDDELILSTISSFKPKDNININKNNQVLSSNMTPVSIVHQYDRNNRLLWTYNKPEFFELLKNKTKGRILKLIGRNDI